AHAGKRKIFGQTIATNLFVANQYMLVYTIIGARQVFASCDQHQPERRVRFQLREAINVPLRRSDVIVFIPENMRGISAINDEYAECNAGDNQVTQSTAYSTWKASCEFFNAIPPAGVCVGCGVGMRGWIGSNVVIGLSCFGFLGHKQITCAVHLKIQSSQKQSV